MTVTNSVLRAACVHRNYWGEEHGTRCAEQLIEEMAELTVEVSHYLRGRQANLVEEIADVEICLTLLKDALGLLGCSSHIPARIKEETYRRTMTEKAERLSRRLEDWPAGDPKVRRGEPSGKEAKPESDA